MTRLGHGALAPKRVASDIAELVGSARQRLKRVLKDHPVETQVPALPPMLCDPILIEQVIVNILDNAAKYAPAGTRRSGSPQGLTARRAELTITDQGPGIPPDAREKVFDMFYRVQDGDRQRAGTGLGLAICRGLVEASGGTIRAEAVQPGWHRHPDRHRPAAGQSRGAGMSARILMVDDEAPIRRFLRVALEAEGYAVTEAATAREGIDRTALDMPALVILDLGLPDADGATVLKAIRGWSDVPVIVLSVRADEAEKVALLDAGAQDYVTKPFGPRELLARIRTCSATGRVRRPAKAR